MSLRVMEIVVAGEDLAGLRETLEKQSVVDLWIEELSSGLGRARVLLPTEKTENVMDLLDERYGGKSGFRVMLLSVEATIPELPEKQDDKASPPASPPVSKSRDVNRVSREELYQDITDGARLSKVFLITVALSTLVAAIGLIRGDVAIIIGAMVIAPLLGPNVALAPRRDAGRHAPDHQLLAHARRGRLGDYRAFRDLRPRRAPRCNQPRIALAHEPRRV